RPVPGDRRGGVGTRALHERARVRHHADACHAPLTPPPPERPRTMPRFDPHPQRRPALISGASSGIGTATARALAALGHPVMLGARREDECARIAEKIRDEGGEAFAARLDVTD